MDSHEYRASRGEILRLALRPLLVLVAFAAAMHLGARLGGWPAPRPTLDIDRTVLIPQAEADRSAGPSRPATCAPWGQRAKVLLVAQEHASEFDGRPLPARVSGVRA